MFLGFEMSHGLWAWPCLGFDISFKIPIFRVFEKSYSPCS